MYNRIFNINLILVGLVCLVITVGCDSSSPTAPSRNIPVNQVPIAPDSLKLSDDAGQALVLSWTDRSDNEDGFYIVRHPLLTKASDTLVLDTLPPNSTSYRDSTINAGTTYRYWVTAFNSKGTAKSVNHAQGSLTPTQSAPTPPSSLRVERSPSSIVLHWDDNSDDEDGFEIQFVKVGAPSGQKSVAKVGPDSTSYKINILTSGAYDIKVRAYKGSVYSNFSNMIRMDYSDQFNLPPSPTNVVLSVRDFIATLTWNDNSSDEIRFWFEFALIPDFSGQVWTDAALPNTTEVELDLSILGVSDTVYVRMWAENSIGISGYSNTAIHNIPHDIRAELDVVDVSPSNFPGTAIAGEKFNFSGWTIENIGHSPATFSLEIYFRPTGTPLDRQRDLIFRVESISINPGGSHNLAYLEYRIPYETENVQQYITIDIDRDNVVNEPNENNNRHSRIVTMNSPKKPDYIPLPGPSDGFIALPKKVGRGEPLLISDWFVRNVRTTNASFFSKCNLYISPDSVITSGDLKLQEYDVPGLAAGQQVRVAAIELLVPPGLTPGLYYVGALVDVNNNIDEVWENNNSIWTTIEIE